MLDCSRLLLFRCVSRRVRSLRLRRLSGWPGLAWPLLVGLCCRPISCPGGRARRRFGRSDRSHSLLFCGCGGACCRVIASCRLIGPDLGRLGWRTATPAAPKATRTAASTHRRTPRMRRRFPFFNSTRSRLLMRPPHQSQSHYPIQPPSLTCGIHTPSNYRHRLRGAAGLVSFILTARRGLPCLLLDLRSPIPKAPHTQPAVISWWIPRCKTSSAAGRPRRRPRSRSRPRRAGPGRPS